MEILNWTIATVRDLILTLSYKMDMMKTKGSLMHDYEAEKLIRGILFYSMLIIYIHLKRESKQRAYTIEYMIFKMKTNGDARK